MAEADKKSLRSTIIFDGRLEIDQNRGVIYFHSEETGTTILRLSNLPHPIPDENLSVTMIDVAHMHGVNYLPQGG